MGFHEIITYSFVSEREYDDFFIDKASDEHQFVRIKNPLGEDLSVMRTTLLPSVVRVAAKNLNRRNLDGRIFELARVYHPQENGALPIEEKRLSLCVYGEKEDFFTLKGVIESLISVFCTGKVRRICPGLRRMPASDPLRFAFRRGRDSRLFRRTSSVGRRKGGN